MYSMFFQKRKSAVPFFYAEVHTQEKLHWSSCTLISHTDLYLHKSNKNNTKKLLPILELHCKRTNGIFQNVTLSDILEMHISYIHM